MADNAPWEDYGGSSEGPWNDYAAPAVSSASEAPTDWGRKTALVGRAAAQGVVGALTLPSTVMTAAANLPPYIANKFFGAHRPYKQSVAEGFSQALTHFGAPTPQTSGENLMSAGVSGLTGGLAGGGAMGVAGIPNALRAGAAGTTGALSQEGARQVGMPWWAQVGAGLLGAQVPAMGESFVRTAGDLAAPLTQRGQSRAVGTLLNQEARDPNAAIQNLQNAAPIVPNSMPTAGPASRDIGLLGVQKYVRGVNQPALGERLSEQNLARQTELGSMAGTENDLKAAITARGQAAGPMYTAAAGQSAPLDNEMVSLMQRPYMQTAIAKAKELADNKGQPFGISSTAHGGPMSLSGRDLQRVKLALDDMKSTSFSQGLGSHQVEALQDTLDTLKGWMQRNVPAQRQADASFQNLSTPINRMQALQELQQKASTTQADVTHGGQYFMTPAGFHKGLDALRENLPTSGVTQSDMTRLSGLMKDLESENSINGPLLKAPGSDTFQNLSLRQNFGGLANFAGKPLGGLYNFMGADKAINELLTRAMLDPKLAASLMQQAQIPRGGLNFRPFDIGTAGGLLGSRP